jgi:hypothetical protein
MPSDRKYEKQLFEDYTIYLAINSIKNHKQSSILLIAHDMNIPQMGNGQVALLTVQFLTIVHPVLIP